MDVGSASFLVIICLLGGIIAFFADRLGRTLGKKRLRLGRMRPRHTAELFTVIAGILIPIITIALVMLLSSDVREWLIRGQRAIAEVELRQKEIKQLSAERDKLKTDRDKIQRELSSLTPQIEELRKKTAAYEQEAKGAEARLAKLNSQVDDLRSTIKRAEAKLAETQVILVATETQRQKAESDLKRTQTAFNEQKRQYDEQLDEYNRLQAENARLTQELESMRKTIDSVRGEKQRVDGELKTATEKRDAATSQLETVQMELARLERDVVNAKISVSGITTSSRMQPLIYKRDEEVARIASPANLSRQAALLEIDRVVRAARVAAEAHGAKSIGSIPAAGVMDRTVGGSRVVTGEQLIQEIARRLTGLDEPMVLIATSSINTFAGEPVSLDIRWFRNPVVFHGGDLVSETRIDGREPLGAILKQISDFLTTKVRERARDSGMVPFAGREDTFGRVSSDEILTLVDQIRDANRPVRLQALASEETRAGDTLKLDFRLRG